MHQECTPNKSIRGTVNTCKYKTCETCLTETTLTEVTVKYHIENKSVVFVQCFSQCTLLQFSFRENSVLVSLVIKRQQWQGKSYKSHNIVILNKPFFTVYIKPVPDYTAELIYIDTEEKKKKPHHSPSVKDICTCWWVANLLLNTQAQFSKNKPSWLCEDKANHNDY